MRGVSILKRYDKQFKEEAIQLVLNQKRPVAAVARELGVHHTTLHTWINQYKKHKEDAFPGSGNLKPDDKEVKQLKKKIADLEEENAILKKATSIFAKSQK
ncbi:MAG: transposase [Firmicutes bacterium]|nr:transposase [Bacillota bacterium]